MTKGSGGRRDALVYRLRRRIFTWAPATKEMEIPPNSNVNAYGPTP
jgi:hypothetical protein